VAHLDFCSWLYGPPTKNVAHPWSMALPENQNDR